MDAEAFIREYAAEQIRAILGGPARSKDSPAIFALSNLIKEKSEGGALLKERFLPVLTTRGEGFDRYTNSQVILAINLLSLGSSPEDELILLSRSYCSSDKDRFKCSEFYLLEQFSETEMSLDDGIAPHYMKIYLGLAGVPEIQKRQKIGNYKIVGIFDFSEIFGERMQFYRKILDSVKGEFDIMLEPNNNLIHANLSLHLSDFGRHEAETDMFRITRESAEKYRIDQTVERFLKIGRELNEKARLENGLGEL
jgi:hypothetical protein